MSTDYDVDLLEGIAAHLAAQGLAVWKTSGVYTTNEHGIFLDTLPDAPDNATALGSYPLVDDPSLAMATIGLQIRTRLAGQDPRASRRAAANIAVDLHGRTHLILETGLHVLQMYRKNGTAPTRDSNDRWTVLQNFTCDLYVPRLNTF